MTPCTTRRPHQGFPLRRPADALLVGGSCLHAAGLLMFPSIPLVAIGLWWNANTVAHNFIHQPFFRSSVLNRAYSCALSGVLGFPQTVWRRRHLAHHGGRPPRLSRSFQLACELVVVLGVWIAVGMLAPTTLLAVYLPGWALGLGLCAAQGYYEHARGTVSCYARLYNALLFNDGYHVEHHRQPGLHWTQLPAARPAGIASVPRWPPARERVSRWPPLLRWLDDCTLDGLERVVVGAPFLQRIVLRWHERAIVRLLSCPDDIRSVLVVGGGLFPRTALVLRGLLPQATLTIVDASREHLDVAATFVGRHIAMREAIFRGAVPSGVDLVVIPLAFVGSRRHIYEQPPGRLTLVHDWIWNRRGTGAVVSWLLLKRINLVVRSPATAAPASLSA